MGELRNLGDDLKAKLGDGVVFLASGKDGKANLIAMVGDETIKKGIKAGDLIKAIAPIVAGGGGGRPNMAQAGGKDPSKIDDAIAAVPVEIKKVLDK